MVINLKQLIKNVFTLDKVLAFILGVISAFILDTYHNINLWTMFILFTFFISYLCESKLSYKNKYIRYFLFFFMVFSVSTIDKLIGFIFVVIFFTTAYKIHKGTTTTP